MALQQRRGHAHAAFLQPIVLRRHPQWRCSLLGALIEGFEKAVALRPAAWKKLLDADVDTAAAMSGMLLLADIARGEQEVEGRDTILAAAPDKIADWVGHPQRMAPCQHRTSAGHRPKGRHIPQEKGRSQRAMPMRLRQEIQEMLRAQLIATAAFTGGLRKTDAVGGNPSLAKAP